MKRKFIPTLLTVALAITCSSSWAAAKAKPGKVAPASVAQLNSAVQQLEKQIMTVQASIPKTVNAQAAMTKKSIDQINQQIAELSKRVTKQINDVQSKLLKRINEK